MQGIIASIIGSVVAFAVLIGAGWWLVRDDRRRRDEESQRHTELIAAIKNHNEETLKAIHQIGGQNGKTKNN
jgi:predicted negative regulator of RcsB-dependent stress response